MLRLLNEKESVRVSDQNLADLSHSFNDPFETIYKQKQTMISGHGSL